jgi:hypothetical protein
VPFIYLLPFVLLSGMAGLVFVAIPRLRRYALQAFVAPLAFAICSIVGMGIVVLAADQFGAFTQPITGMEGAIQFFGVFVIPGLFGASLAVWIISRIQRFFSK